MACTLDHDALAAEAKAKGVSTMCPECDLPIYIHHVPWRRLTEEEAMARLEEARAIQKDLK